VRVTAPREYRGIHTDIGEQELRFIFRHKSLEGVLLPESSPRVLRDPPFVQGLVTLFPSRNTIQRSPCHATCKNCYDTPLCIHICIHIHIYMYKCVHFFGTPFKEVFVTPCAKKVLSRRFVYVYVIIYTYACVCTLSAQHVKKFVPCHV